MGAASSISPHGSRQHSYRADDKMIGNDCNLSDAKLESKENNDDNIYVNRQKLLEIDSTTERLKTFLNDAGMPNYVSKSAMARLGNYCLTTS
jgi:hypothetical protein